MKNLETLRKEKEKHKQALFMKVINAVKGETHADANRVLIDAMRHLEEQNKQGIVK